jgi:hypothetical protein
MNLAHVLSLLKGFVWKVGCGGALIRFDGMLHVLQEVPSVSGFLAGLALGIRW